MMNKITINKLLAAGVAACSLTALLLNYDNWHLAIAWAVAFAGWVGVFLSE